MSVRLPIWAGPDRIKLFVCEFSASRGIATRSAMHNYSLVARNVRPPRSYKLLWGRMRFGSFRMRKRGNRWVRSDCWTKCRICKGKILPLEVYPACLCFLCTYLSEPASVGDNFAPTPTLPLWESESDPSVRPSGPDRIEPDQTV